MSDMISSEKELFDLYKNVRYFTATRLGQSSVLDSTTQKSPRPKNAQNQTLKNLPDQLLQ
jgi:hypothetical protein